MVLTATAMYVTVEHTKNATLLDPACLVLLGFALLCLVTSFEVLRGVGDSDEHMLAELAWCPFF